MYLDDIKVKVQLVRNKGKVRGVGSLELGNMEQRGIRVVGIKILNGNIDEGYRDNEGNPLWVAPPAYNDGVGRYKNILFATPVLWKEIQGLFIQEFLLQESDSA